MRTSKSFARICSSTLKVAFLPGQSKSIRRGKTPDCVNSVRHPLVHNGLIVTPNAVTAVWQQGVARTAPGLGIPDNFYVLCRFTLPSLLGAGRSDSFEDAPAFERLHKLHSRKHVLSPNAKLLKQKWTPETGYRLKVSGQVWAGDRGHGRTLAVPDG